MKLTRLARRFLLAVTIMLFIAYEYIKFFVGPIHGDAIIFIIVTATIGSLALLIESFEGKKKVERRRGDGE